MNLLHTNRTSCSDNAKPRWNGTAMRPSKRSVSAKSMSASRTPPTSATTSSAPALSQVISGACVRVGHDALGEGEEAGEEHGQGGSSHGREARGRGRVHGDQVDVVM
ncbi:hypothetical protein BS78_06G050400 [Paspalum vaginatum]|nr:hypothetical protein BS78_06G050400 [Paspalum vaginatum]